MNSKGIEIQVSLVNGKLTVDIKDELKGQTIHFVRNEVHTDINTVYNLGETVSGMLVMAKAPKKSTDVTSLESEKNKGTTICPYCHSLRIYHSDTGEYECSCPGKRKILEPLWKKTKTTKKRRGKRKKNLDSWVEKIVDNMTDNHAMVIARTKVVSDLKKIDPLWKDAAAKNVDSAASYIFDTVVKHANIERSKRGRKTFLVWVD